MIIETHTNKNGTFVELNVQRFYDAKKFSQRKSHATLQALTGAAQQISSDSIPKDSRGQLIHPEIVAAQKAGNLILDTDSASSVGNIKITPGTTALKLINSAVADGVTFGPGRYVLENVFVAAETKLFIEQEVRLRNCVIGPRNTLMLSPGATYDYVILGEGNFISECALKDYFLMGDSNVLIGTTIAEEVTLGSHNDFKTGAHIGAKCLVGDSNFIGADVTLSARAQLGHQNHLGISTKIGHDSFMGSHCHIDAEVKIGRGCAIEDFVRIGENSSIGNSCYINTRAFVEENSTLSKGTESPGRPHPQPESFDNLPGYSRILGRLSHDARGPDKTGPEAIARSPNMPPPRALTLRLREISERRGEFFPTAGAPLIRPPGGPVAHSGESEEGPDNKNNTSGGVSAGLIDGTPRATAAAAEDEAPNDEEVNIARLQRLSAKDIKLKLDEYVIGQEDAKKALAVIGYNYIQGNYGQRIDSSIALASNHALLIGSTGCGKTLLVKTLARILGLPFSVFDTTQFTEAGFKGNNISMITDYLDYSTDGRAVVLLDEFDKLYKKAQNWGLSIQNEFLKFLEGEVLNDEIDTSKVLFILTGVFQGLADIIRMRLLTVEKRQLSPAQLTDNFLLRNVSPDDLAMFGMSREILGRLPVIQVLEELSRESLIDVFFNSKNSIYRQYQERFAMISVKLNFTSKGVERLVDLCLQRRVGARGLVTEMNKLMTHAIYSASSNSNITEIRVGAHDIDRGVATLIHNPTQHIN